MLWLGAAAFLVAGYLTRVLLERLQHEHRKSALRVEAKEAIVAGVMEGLDDLARVALSDGPPERPEVN